MLARLADNAAVVARATTRLTHSANAGGRLTPADECLLDNIHLIEEQVRTAPRSLPKAYSRRLPRLADPAGMPRVYQLALEVIAHGDGRFEREGLVRLIEAYQEVAPLTLGELRAIPIMLRLVLIENLRRLSARLEDGCAQRDLASAWAGRMAAVAESRPGDLILEVADMERAVQPMGSSFIAELAHRLQGQSGVLPQALEWVAMRLKDAGSTIEQQVQADMAAQDADLASISNSVKSLRLLGATDWRQFVETMSAVEQTLRLDPAGTYARMDFSTRDHYRHVVERLARQCGHTEPEVAAEALALAGEPRSPTEGGLDLRLRHIGYYLIGPGLPLLGRRLQPRSRALARLRRVAPLPAYLGAIGLFTVLLSAAVVAIAQHGGAEGGLLVLLAVLAAICSSQLALALVNAIVTRLVTPKPLPRMDFSCGIPADCQSIVVVPSLLASSDNVAALCEALEVHYLANRERGGARRNLRFCLLTDLADAPQQEMFGDAELVEQARVAIELLNARYGHAHQIDAQNEEGEPGQVMVRFEPFLLLHRPRTWNESEQAWIGRERKQGQLADFNLFLRGGARDRFAVVVGGTEGLANVRYVITLDADTRLPRDAARKFVAAMAHPLNQPVLDPASGRVIEGYGILQPRVLSQQVSENASRYERLFCAEPGVSDLYQDLFGEGTFAGKGIYEVDTFERVLDQRLPDNVLSTDQLAGGYVRAGLLSDDQLYEPCPASYGDDASRRCRWIRGDWQLAPWLRSKVPAAGGGREPNPLSPFARWKLFDNLRRSLVAPSLTALLLCCWALLTGPALWSAAVLVVFFLPAFAGALVRLLDKPENVSWRAHLADSMPRARIAFCRAVLGMIFLPHEAWYSVDAIARTAWRMLVSRRHLLQWKASVRTRSSNEMERNWCDMWFSPVLAVGTATLLSFANPLALFAAAPLLLLWFLAPVVAWWISRPAPRQAPRLSTDQKKFLHLLARRTWSFFETHLGPADNWLPPDQMQEQPTAVVVHRTSPTNIGMALLANLTAWDFGFIATSTLLARSRATLSTMAGLARYRGHFYNWYDTQTLEPLQPLYISSADSGNLAAHLLTLASGLAQLADQPIAGARSLAGICATVQVLVEACAGEEDLREALAALAHQLSPERCSNLDTLPGQADCLQAACIKAEAIVATLTPSADPEIRGWAGKLAAQCQAARDELFALAPWMHVAQEYVLDASLTRIPTLRELAGFSFGHMPSGDPAPEQVERHQALAKLVAEGRAEARARLSEIEKLAGQARAFAVMDFGLLYDAGTRLLATGYDVGEHRLDAASCDLLASETRLASFVAIAQGQLPQEHWFALGRQMCSIKGEQMLLSRSGSMSEYLMPVLVMPTYRNTLLDQACRGIVGAQIDYGSRNEVPWGISESCYNAIDASSNYQYREFGVPGARLKREQGDDLVIAPYATMLALMVEPEQACANLQRLAQLDLMCRYGFYDAVDYTADRLGHGQDFAVVRAFMTRHQGMGLLALSHLLHDRPMQRRFVADPQFQATLLLLQEPQSDAVSKMFPQ